MAIIDILEQFHLLFVYNSRHYTIIVVWLVAMVPLSLLQNVQSLQYASAVGIMAIATLIVAAFVHCLQHQHQPQGLQSSSSSESSNVSVLLKLLSHWRNLLNATPNSIDSENKVVSLMDFLWPVNGLVSILTSGPVVLFAFSCQPNVCSIYDELVVVNDDDSHRPSDNGEAVGMNHPTSTKKLRLMHRVTIVAVCICAVLYCSISVIALADFGNNVRPNMLSCYSNDDTGTNGGNSSTLMQIATAAMALAIVMAFPLNIFPARVTVIGLWYSYCKHRQLSAALSNSNLDRSLSLHGIVPHEGLTAALLDGEYVEERLLPTTTNIENTSSSDRSLVSPLTNGNYHEIENSANGQAATINFSDNNPPFNRTVHIVSTLLLTTSTLMLALILPNISVVFGLLGGTASSWLGFCVPGLLGIQLSKNERLSGQPTRFSLLLTSWALLFGGVIIGVLTTGVTIYNTIKH